MLPEARRLLEGVGEPQNASLVLITPHAQCIRIGRCFKGVDPRLESDSKFVTIDEEANHQIVHGRRFGKANGAPYEPLDPGPQID